MPDFYTFTEVSGRATHTYRYDALQFVDVPVQDGIQTQGEQPNTGTTKPAADARPARARRAAPAPTATTITPTGETAAPAAHTAPRHISRAHGQSVRHRIVTSSGAIYEEVSPVFSMKEAASDPSSAAPAASIPSAHQSTSADIATETVIENFRIHDPSSNVTDGAVWQPLAIRDNPPVEIASAVPAIIPEDIVPAVAEAVEAIAESVPVIIPVEQPQAEEPKPLPKVFVQPVIKIEEAARPVPDGVYVSAMGPIITDAVAEIQAVALPVEAAIAEVVPAEVAIELKEPETASPEEKPAVTVAAIQEEPILVEPVQIEPVEEPVKIESVKIEPVKIEPVKIEPVKAPVQEAVSLEAHAPVMKTVETARQDPKDPPKADAPVTAEEAKAKGFNLEAMLRSMEKDAQPRRDRQTRPPVPAGYNLPQMRSNEAPPIAVPQRETRPAEQTVRKPQPVPARKPVPGMTPVNVDQQNRGPIPKPIIAPRDTSKPTTPDRGTPFAPARRSPIIHAPTPRPIPAPTPRP